MEPLQEETKDGRGLNAENKRPSNYFSIHGTISGGLVAAKSNLAIEVLQQFILKALNLRGEVVFPDDFNDFKGVDGKTVVTNNTEQFSLQFGYKSTFDNATERLFKEYGEKSEGGNGWQQSKAFRALAPLGRAEKGARRRVMDMLRVALVCVAGRALVRA